MYENNIGTLKIVASTGGLKLFGSDKWINPAQKVTEDGMKHLESLKSKKVLIKLNDNGKYVNIDICTDHDTKSTQNSAPRPMSPPDTQTSIIRQSCLKVAGEVMKTRLKQVDDTTEQLSMLTIDMAERFESWVTRCS
ncbi:MAG: hypothetical protein KAK00_00385 [Nanoarchaeota archaeon]|nr:hypothetical protein [Nanoarchaeota archaeon]